MNDRAAEWLTMPDLEPIPQESIAEIRAAVKRMEGLVASGEWIEFIGREQPMGDAIYHCHVCGCEFTYDPRQHNPKCAEAK
jgi:hypothetical protein